MKATRDKKIAFINSFGPRGLREAVAEIICREGDGFLTDEQIDALASMRVDDARSTQKHNRLQRTIYQARTDVTMFRDRPDFDAKTGVPA